MPAFALAYGLAIEVIQGLAPTGRRVDIEGVDLYEFRDGLISHWKIIYDLYDFTQQVGLLPPPNRGIPTLMLRAQRLVAARQRRRTRT